MEIDEQWFYSLLKEIKKGGKDTNFDKFYKSLTVIQEMKDISSSMGEKLTDEDIQYALKYGRSVIADYSV